MPIDNWLHSLSQPDSHAVDSDLASLAQLDYPFLSSDQSRNQITRLSGNLGRMRDDIRRLTIAYSLYARQLDVIQDRASKDICASGCGRPPVGCCTADHFIIFSLSDIMISTPSSRAMQLCDSIQRLQKSENDFHGQDAHRIIGHCAYLTSRGCTLRLFKSPLCIHYLCQAMGNKLRVRFHGQAAPFVEAMHEAATHTITSTADFTSPAVLAAVPAMFAGQGGEA